MFSQFFGHYLLNNGLLTREQLADALQFQQSVHVKFGVIAVDEGFLTPAQVEKIHDVQKQVDKRFGEIAVDLGFLTENQVEAMLSAQKPNHLLLAQALVDRGYMSIEQFSNALNEYKQHYSLSEEKFEAIKQGDIDVIVHNLLSDGNPGETDRFIKYLSLFTKNMIRFIDDGVYLSLSGEDEQNRDNWLVYQNIVGEAPLFTAISATENIFLHIASAYAEETLTEVDELAQASVSEFLNLHNGIYLVNMSNEGYELTMEPQSVERGMLLEGNLIMITVHTSKGPFQLALSDQPVKLEKIKVQEIQQLT